MWRLLVIAMLLVSWGASSQLAMGQGQAERWSDLAAVPVPPHELPEDGYQFARGGYLSLPEARYVV